MIHRHILALVLVLSSPAFADEQSSGDTPSVAVQTTPPKQGSAPAIVTAYGSAMPALNGSMTLSLQQEGRVLSIDVTPGEAVHAGQRLIGFGASATAISTYQQASNSLAAARQQRTHTAQLLAQHLATRDQLAQADKAVADAQATLDALKQEGADRSSQVLAAPFDGIIATIPVAPGDRLQPNAPLMTITRLDGLVITIGVEPADLPRIQPGEPVHLTPLTGGPELDGKIVRVDNTLNPKTRLVDADVSIPAGSVLSGAAFKADIKVGELTGWIVPHDALLSDAKGSYLFQVAGTAATRVDVQVAGPAGPDDIIHGTLDPHRPIVVQGNYQLSDNTPVRISDTRSGPAPSSTR